MSAVVCGKRASSCFEELTHAPGSSPVSKRARCGGSASPPPQATWLVDAADPTLVADLSARFPAMSLEDHMRWAGDVCFSDVYREAGATVGIVDYTNYDDMKYAIRKLDDTEFRNAFSRAYIRVREYDARSRSRSRSRSYSRSHSYSRSMTPRSVSRSVSPVDERSLSRSRSPVYFASRGRSVRKPCIDI